ncbi:MAG: Spy/CpxP family protein refolding chaperone [Bradymonadia bacterium]
MKHQYLINSLLIAMLSLFSISSAYASPESGARKHRVKKIMKVLKSLNLDRTVRKDIRQTMRKTRRDMVPLKSKLEAAKIQLQELMEADNIDRNAVMKAIDAVAIAKTNIQKRRVSAMLSIREKLTPEQRDLFRKKMNEGPNRPVKFESW